MLTCEPKSRPQKNFHCQWKLFTGYLVAQLSKRYQNIVFISCGYEAAEVVGDNLEKTVKLKIYYAFCSFNQPKYYVQFGFIL